MEPHTMLQTSAVVFLLAAIAGVAVIRVVRRRNPSLWVAMAHGLLAAAGFTLLRYAAFAGGASGATITAALLLVVAAVGGIALNPAWHLRNRPLPRSVTIAHAVPAVAGSGLVLVLVTTFG